MPDQLLRFTGSTERDPALEAWWDFQSPGLRAVARQWFDRIRECGDDVRELLHDGQAVACVYDAPFAEVGVYKAHVNVSFFYGTELDDPAGLLEGSGRRMRHVKVKPSVALDAAALGALIDAAYADIKARLAEAR
jgi:hypothetical protein